MKVTWSHVAIIPLVTVAVAGTLVIVQSIAEKKARESWARVWGVKS